MASRIIINVTTINKVVSLDVTPSCDGNVSPQEQVTHNFILKCIDLGMEVLLQNADKGQMFIGKDIEKEVSAALARIRLKGGI